MQAFSLPRIVLAPAAALLLVLSPALALRTSVANAQTMQVSCTENDQSMTVNAYGGTQFAIGLRSNVTTGYSWQLATPPDPSVAQVVSDVYVSPGAASSGQPLAGAPGRECWIFSAVGVGNTTITLNYSRPFDPPGTPPAQTATFKIAVQGD